MKTYVATPENRQRDWYVVDAEGKTLGRLATQIADALKSLAICSLTKAMPSGRGC
jgi:ribosomal protein L13